MSECNPIQLTNTVLEEAEQHLQSYTVAPYCKDFSGNYSASLAYYTLHLTTKRLIVEPYVNQKLLGTTYSIMSHIPISHNALALLSIIYKKMNQAKRNMDLINHTSISLNYGSIEKFETFLASSNTSLVRVLLKQNLQRPEVKVFKQFDLEVFKVQPVQQVSFDRTWNTFLEKGIKNTVHEFWERITESSYMVDPAFNLVMTGTVFLRICSEQSTSSL